MRPLFLAVSLVVSTLTLGSLPFGQALANSDAPDVDVAQVLSALKQIEEKHTATTSAILKKSIHDFNTAAASNAAAIDLFEQATRATQFAGQNLQQTQFQEWKKKNVEKLKSLDMQEAARLHLKYLAITLHLANKVPADQLLTDLIRYTEEVYNSKAEELTKQPLMAQPLTSSIFVQWYGIPQFVQGLKQWELVPANADGIWEKTILPELRKKNDLRAVHYWDHRIEREGKKLGDTKRTFTLDQYSLVVKPTLLWNRAQELAHNGMRNHAINSMLAVIKDYPTHPHNGTWIEKLKATLAPTSEAQ